MRTCQFPPFNLLKNYEFNGRFHHSFSSCGPNQLDSFLFGRYLFVNLLKMTDLTKTSIVFVLFCGLALSFGEDDLFLGEPLGDLPTWEPPAEIKKDYPYYHAGYDEENRPIWIIEFGRWDVRKMVEKGGEDLKNFEKYIRQAAYRLVKSVQSRSTPEQPVTDAIFISDSDGLAVGQVAHVPTVTFIASQARKYTELIGSHIHVGFVLNNNFVAETLTNILKPIYGRVLEKVEIYGTNPAKFIPQLLRHIPKDQLPEWYGGSKDFKPVQIYG